MSAVAPLLGAWAPALVYMAAIWLLSSLSLAPLPVADLPMQDKLVHFVEYGVLGFLLAHAATRTWPRVRPIRTLAFAVTVTALWGLLDEIHQAFVPSRSPEVLDLVADTLGACAGAFALRIFFAGRLARPREASR